MSILGFLSRGGSQKPAAAPAPPTTTWTTVPPPPTGTLPPVLNRYAPRPTATSPAPANKAPENEVASKENIPLTPNYTLSTITAAHIPSLRTLNSLTLPVSYGDGFYAATLFQDPWSGSGLYSRVILYHPPPKSKSRRKTGQEAGKEGGEAEGKGEDSKEEAEKPEPIVAGAIICRLEPASKTDPKSNTPTAPQQEGQVEEITLYIQSLALFSPYRSQGLMTLSLSYVLRNAVLHHPPSCPSRKTRLTAVRAHVWTENAEALHWYKSQGFTCESNKPLEGYYHRLRPGTAWIVRRELKMGDVLGVGDTAASTAGTTTATTNGNNRSGSTTPSIIPPPPLPSAASPSSSPSPKPPPPSASVGPGLSIAPPRNPSTRPTPTPSPAPSQGGKSFQNTRPDMEWNDLPSEMSSRASSRERRKVGGNGGANGGGGGSTTTSSRSSSVAGGKKRGRGYPAAAFGA